MILELGVPCFVEPGERVTLMGRLTFSPRVLEVADGFQLLGLKVEPSGQAYAEVLNPTRDQRMKVFARLSDVDPWHVIDGQKKWKELQPEEQLLLRLRARADDCHLCGSRASFSCRDGGRLDRLFCATCLKLAEARGLIMRGLHF